MTKTPQGRGPGGTPARPTRPTIVTAAYWLWFLAAAACLLTSFAFITATPEVVSSTRPGITDPQAFATTLRWLGFVVLAIGIVIAALSRFVRQGDPRVRRTLAVFSGALLVFFIGVFGIVGPYGMLVAVPSVVASVLVYRPSAQPWFTQ